MLLTFSDKGLLIEFDIALKKAKARTSRRETVSGCFPEVERRHILSDDCCVRGNNINITDGMMAEINDTDDCSEKIALLDKLIKFIEQCQRTA